MSWVIAIFLALAAFAVLAFVFRQPRGNWTVLLAALAFGLAGFATQASPGLPGAPAQPNKTVAEEGPQFVLLRNELVGQSAKSRSPYILMADERLRRGKYEGAITLLRGVVSNNPKDGDAWLALANALFLHADGRMTPAARMAYLNADSELPNSAAPTFFIGVVDIREGRLVDAHRLWSQRLALLPEDAPGRAILEQRLAVLDELLRRIVEESGKDAE